MDPKIKMINEWGKLGAGVTFWETIIQFLTESQVHKRHSMSQPRVKMQAGGSQATIQPFFFYYYFSTVTHCQATSPGSYWHIWYLRGGLSLRVADSLSVRLGSGPVWTALTTSTCRRRTWTGTGCDAALPGPNTASVSAALGTPSWNWMR